MTTMRVRTALIAGAAGNLGHAVATRFAQAGWKLALLDAQPMPQDRSAAMSAAGTGTLSLAVDLLDRAATGKAVEIVCERMGGIDVLCNLAGGFRMSRTVHESDTDLFDLLFGQNVKTMLHTLAAVVPRMLASGGCIVNVGAAAACRGTAGMGLYQASKASVQRLTESMSAELRDQGIRVNCVLPSIIDTPANRAALPAADPGRWVSPQALADVIHFLCDDGARAVHGASIPVTGRV